VALKYGRRAPKNADAIPLGAILTGTVPEHPAVQDNLASLPGWQMLGNDSAGDCVAVTWANLRRLITAVLGDHEVYPSQDWVWQVYKTQNPDFDPNGSEYDNGPGSSADQGMDIQTLLEYLVKTGGPDGVKALAFAKVDHTNAAEVDAALSIFGGVWTGIVVQQAQEQQFDAGQAWDWVAGSPEEGGHSVLAGGYAETGSTTGVDFITWAKETRFTPAYVRKGVEEMWVVIWPEHLSNKAFQVGISLTALAAAYTAITGRPFPAVSPTPTPAPTPTPTPDNDLLAAVIKLWNELKAWATGRHSGANADAAKKIEQFAKDQGLS
jgi:hypothetical protein